MAVLLGLLSGVTLSLGGFILWRRFWSQSTPLEGLSETSPEREDVVDYERLLAEIDEAIAFQSGDGTVIFANRAFSDIVGSNPEGVDVESALSPVPNLKRRVVAGEEGVAPVESDDGTTYYDIRFFSLSDGTDSRLILFHDVTNHQEQKKRLEKQNRQLDRFASLVSHDLRNPLDVAIGRTKAIATETTDPELKTHVQSAQQALQRMNRIITDVLALARNGKQIGDTESISLAEIGRDAWQTVETKGSTLVIETDTVITANAEGLTRIFENLFRNAVEHAGKNVTVTVGDLPSDAGFYVEDDGPGISPSHREQFCEPGETGNNGTGLGLAIVDSVADAHDWKLTITESKTGGARFEFSDVADVSTGVATESS